MPINSEPFFVFSVYVHAHLFPVECVLKYSVKLLFCAKPIHSLHKCKNNGGKYVDKGTYKTEIFAQEQILK